MSLTMALNGALNGMQISQRALAVISNNITNANTEGYSRQQVDVSAVYLDGQLAGAKIDDITRRTDEYLQKSITKQSGIVGRTTTLTSYMDRIQTLMGQPGASNSIDEYAINFFNALQSLSETPERVSYREEAVNSAEVLAREFSGLAGDLEGLRQQADSDISSGVTKANQILSKLYAINTSINRATALNNPTSGLQDARDQALKELSDYLDVSTYTHENGEVSVYTANGVSLLDENMYQLRYNPATTLNAFTGDQDMNALDVVLYNESGEVINNPTPLLSTGHGDGVVSILNQGKLQALHELRDKLIPDILSQLDEYTAKLRDEFNAVHNNGSSYPGTDELTGTRQVTALDRYNWSGSVQIGVLDGDGKPITSPYADETTGVRPLTLDLSFLDSGTGAGQPTTQTIVDEINNFFNPAPVKTKLGNLNNIQMVSDVKTMPQAPASFAFDFDLENISGSDSKFYVTDVTVVDDTGTNITTASNTMPPQVALNAGNTYTTTAGSNMITLNANSHGLSVGDRIYLSDPGVSVNGIAAADLTGYFEISAMTANSFTVQLGSNANATSTGSASVAGVTATPPWDTIAGGEKTRIRDAGTMNVDLTGNAGSAYYDITVNVGVDDGKDSATNIKTSTITYRIFNNDVNLLNDRYNSTAAVGQASRVVPSTNDPIMRAMLVDADGNELLRTNGEYSSEAAYLKLVTSNPDYTIAIEEKDSKQLGDTFSSPQEAGTNRGFSHYFEMNNFFKSNISTTTGDTVKGSAYNFAVEDRIANDSNLITIGNLQRSNQPADPTAAPLYTYERAIGDNSVIQQLADIGSNNYQFAQAGGIASTNQSMTGYVGDILAYSAAKSSSMTSDDDNANILLEGFAEKADSFSGVNVDEELANTVIYQHAYTASARVITVANAMFDALFSAFN
jgi:flagellar hook-associated protein 1 FlgK